MALLKLYRHFGAQIQVIQLILYLIMHSKKPIEIKASDLLKNFSRNYHENHYHHQEEIPLKMKSRKVAFTSRVLHSSRNHEPDPNIGLSQKAQKQKQKLKLEFKIPDSVILSPPVINKKKIDPITKMQKRSQQEIFNFKSNPSFKRRILSPKILRINVNSARSKQRSMSAKSASANIMPKNREIYYNNVQHQRNHNPQICRGFNSFEFTFGIHQRF